MAASLIPPTTPMFSLVTCWVPGDDVEPVPAPQPTTTRVKNATANLLINLGTLLLIEFALAERAAQLPGLVPEVLGVAVEAVAAVGARDPEDAGHQRASSNPRRSSCSGGIS